MKTWQVDLENKNTIKKGLTCIKLLKDFNIPKTYTWHKTKDNSCSIIDDQHKSFYCWQNLSLLTWPSFPIAELNISVN